MTAEEILAWFKANNPKTLSEINAAGIETNHIGSGGSRDVYALISTSWVVKIQNPHRPLTQQRSECIALAELNQNTRATGLVPTLIYRDPRDECAMIIVTCCPIEPAVDARVYFRGVLLERLNLNLPEWRFEDMGYQNVRLDTDGNPRLVDLGNVRKI